MSGNNSGQVIRSAAEVYDQFFVPALFGAWARRVADAAHVTPGQHLLDVATGTGVLARVVAERVGPTGSVVGVDINKEMLAVAQRAAPHIQWQQGAAEELPFEDHRFDAVVSQFGLMFFEDRGAAIREMSRVLKPEGWLTIAVWAALEESPGYADLAVLLDQMFGSQVAEALYAPFNLGDTTTLRSEFEAAGLRDMQILTLTGTARFPSLDAWMHTEIKGWTLADKINDEQFQHLLRKAHEALQTHIAPNGSVEFAISAHVVTVGQRIPNL